jgi:hypothetical protein
MRNAGAVLLFLTAVFLPAAARADCAGLSGQRAVLVSNSYDPDVLLWDSRQRLMDYAAGNWDVAKVLLPHALLARAGTRAVVTACQVNVVHPKYRLAPMDAVGVKVTSGPYKGRYVWVLSDDLRVDRERTTRGRRSGVGVNHTRRV